MKFLMAFFLGIIAISMIFITINVMTIDETLREYQQVQERDNMEYQLMLGPDSIRIWDNERYVGALPYDNSKLDSLLRQDNE